MVRADRPRADEYDNNEQVAPHFSKTPGLTALPPSYRYYEVGQEVKREVGDLYNKNGFTRCRTYGLYWAGYPSWTRIKERTKTLLLVVDLKEDEIKQWWKMDDDVRKILRRYDLSGRHQVCVRYYQYWEGREEEEAEEMVSESQRVEAESRTRRLGRLGLRTSRHVSATPLADSGTTSRILGMLEEMAEAASATSTALVLDRERTGGDSHASLQRGQPTVFIAGHGLH